MCVCVYSVCVCVLNWVIKLVTYVSTLYSMKKKPVAFNLLIQTIYW